MVTFKNSLLVFGGTKTGEESLSTIEKYDVKTNQWKQLTIYMPISRQGHSAVVIRGAGELVYNTPFLMTTSIKRRLTMLNLHLYTYILVFISLLLVLLVGGYNHVDGHLKFVDALALANWQWTSLPPLREARDCLAALAYNGVVFAIGGYNNESGPLRSIEKINISKSMEWTMAGNLHVAREGLVAILI